jgi:hypothetical protein
MARCEIAIDKTTRVSYILVPRLKLTIRTFNSQGVSMARPHQPVRLLSVPVCGGALDNSKGSDSP